MMSIVLMVLEMKIYLLLCDGRQQRRLQGHFLCKLTSIIAI